MQPKFFCFFIAFLFFSRLSFSVIPNEQKIHTIDSILLLSQKASFDVDIQGAISYGMIALSESNSIGYEKGKISAYNFIGQAMFNSGNYKEALHYLSMAERVKTKMNFPLSLTQIYKTQGQIYFMLGMTEYSLEKLHKSLSTAQKIIDDNNRNFVTGQLYEVISDIHKQLGNTDSVNVYIHKNLQLIELMNPDVAYPVKINLLTFIASHYIDEGAFDNVCPLIYEADELIKKYDYPYISNTLRVKGDMFCYQNMQDSALVYYKSAEENIISTDLRQELPILYMSISRVYDKMGKVDSSRLYREMSLVAERDVMSQTLSASSIALETLLREERVTANKRGNKLYIITVVVIVLLGGGLLLLILSRKKHPLSKERRLMNLAANNDEKFVQEFQKLHQEFNTILINQYPNLTDSELSLCYMTYLDIPTKEIAEFTEIESRSVQTKRSRLRKKMDIPTDVDFGEFLRGLLN